MRKKPDQDLQDAKIDEKKGWVKIWENPDQDLEDAKKMRKKPDQDLWDAIQLSCSTGRCKWTLGRVTLLVEASGERRKLFFWEKIYFYTDSP